MKEHNQLLKEYAESGDESAFSELVGRYIDLVYSIAMRRMGGDVHLAEDVAQTVFLDLARKADSLTNVSMLGGWLHRHTCFVASNLQRTERRRQAREWNNQLMNALPPDENDAESQIKSCLDEAIEELEPNDRQAVLLRFFEKQSLKDVGQFFGSSEDAAQKRVSRAVEKLRDLLLKRGVTVSAIALMAHLSANAISAAPASFTKSVLTYVRDTLSSAPSAALNDVANLSAWGKAAFAAVVAICFGALVFWPSDNPVERTKDLNGNLSAEQSVHADAGSSPFTTLMAAESESDNIVQPKSDDSFKERMELTIVGKETGEAVAGAVIDYLGWADQSFHKHQFLSNEEGLAFIDVPFDTITHLQLTVRIDGYADTQLDWRVDRGEQVPLFYTVKLDSAVTIGGVVQDPEGQPIANAKVGFNHKDSAAAVPRPESHAFGWIEVETDASGRWRINRIGADMIPRLYGGARHEDYVGSESLFVSENAASEKSLKTETHVFKLKPAARVSGIVLGPDDSPVQDATVLIGSRGSINSRETKTKADGTFQLKGCQPGTGFVTASAPGFAATTIRTDIDDGMSALKLRLQFAKTLRLRVVDQLHRPVPEANIWLDTIPRNFVSDDAHPPLTQVEFHEKTDQDGRVVWNEAPDKALRFDIAANGYMRVNGFEARPGDMEYVVQLPSALEVFGTVRDAETLNDIDTFSILVGWPDTSSAEDEVHASWSALGRHRMTFSGGRFRHIFQEAIIHGMPNPGYILKIESEGFAPHVTRVIAPDEVQAPFDILLEPAEVVSVQTFLPSGKPAVAADIGLALGKTSYAVGAGRISRDSNGTVLVTDANGRFNLPSDDAIHRIIVAHPEGFTEVDPGEVRERKQIQMQRWGALSGQYVSQALKPHQKIALRSIYGYSYPFHASDAFNVVLDEEGRFQMDSVPPGRYQLSLRIERDDPQGKSWSYKNIMPVDIHPGEVLDLKLDFGSARFQLVWPDDLERKDSWTVHAWVTTPSLQIPEALKNNPEALSAWAQKPETQAMMNSTISQNFAEQEDGWWLANEVVPNESYTLEVRVIDPSGSPQQYVQIASGQKKVRIPYEQTEGPIDLGVVELERLNP